MFNYNDGNERLQHYLEGGSKELRNFVTGTIISGNPRELDRITKYYLFWKFYDGQHYREYNDSMMAFNYVKAFVDKVNLFLLGDAGFSFQVTSYDNDVISDKLETAAEKLMLKTWRRNKLQLFTHELLQMGGICGDAWVGLNWWEKHKCVKFTLFDSRHCFPQFKDGDISKLQAFTVRESLENNQKNYKVMITRYTTETVEIWYQDTTADKVEGKDRKEYKTTKNPLGVIPVVHFKNRPVSSSYFGKSDMHDILKLNKVYNELNQELKTIIDYHVTPTTVVTGGTVKNMKRGIGNVWSGLPENANVFNLGLDVDLSAATSYAQSLKTAMHEISDIPENVLGKLQAISGTSAAALKMTYLPLVQQANLKALTYGEGIIEMNEMILAFYKYYNAEDELFKALPDDFIENYRCEAIFPYGFPMDRLGILQESQIELQLRVNSRKAIMNRLGFNNVPELQDEIDADVIANAQLDVEVQTMEAQAANENAPVNVDANSTEKPKDKKETKPAKK